MAAQYELYYAPLSQPSRSALMVIKLVNAPHKIHPISLREGDNQKPEFLKLNPFHAVPVLAHGDFTLTEGTAIGKYILATNKGPDNLYPADPKKRARVDEYLSYQHTTVRKAGVQLIVNLVFAPRRTGKPAPEEKKKELLKNFHDVLEGFEGYFLKDDFIAGKQVSIADIYALSEIVQVGMTGESYIPAHPKTAAWIERTKGALQPHYDEVFKELNEFVAAL